MRGKITEKLNRLIARYPEAQVPLALRVALMHLIYDELGELEVQHGHRMAQEWEYYQSLIQSQHVDALSHHIDVARMRKKEHTDAE